MEDKLIDYAGYDNNDILNDYPEIKNIIGIIVN